MNDKPRSFEFSPVGAAAKWFFAVLTLLPILVVGVIWWGNPDEFTGMPLWLLGLLFGIGPAVLIAAAMGVRNPQAKLGKDGLSIKVSFIDKHWALNSIDRANAALVNLESRQELRPKWKLWGAAMPGLSSGLFKLYDGRKAHVYITDRSKVVYLPTQSGPVLLSLERPREFLDTLQAL
ncbi:PH domain-containing protein [Arenimonas sp. GDDSR-1]|uniref:PH domain-containing protein n=1 Tax=Arenimonas sp. GDDSR-1 TaxID=2950125 RepID=UPI00262D5E66|nr:PH domain-containing protein [Arenimonas sp. GDDSR-1]